MANNLTGDYEAVLQIRLPKINAILATLHQAKMDPNAQISFPHGVSFRVGDSPFASQLERERHRFVLWTSKAAKKLSDVTDSPEEIRRVLLSQTPPGLVPKFEYSWRGLDLSGGGAMPALGGRDLSMLDHSEDMAKPGPGGTGVGVTMLEPVPSAGRVDCQISTPIITIPAASQVRVSVWVRAHFYRDDGTVVPTPPIHGEVRAVYVVTPVTLAAGPALRVKITSDDNQIEFVSPTLLSAANAKTLISHVRDALRKKFVPVDVMLPPGDIGFSEFKALGSGSSEAVVVPVSLSPGLPAGTLGSLTNHFLGSEDLAFALGKDYMQRFFDDLRESVRAALARVTITFEAWWNGTTIYSLSLSALDVSLKAGGLDIVGSVAVTGRGGLAPEHGYVNFTQGVAIVLVGQTVSVEAIGDPAVDESWFIPHDRALNEVKKARDSALQGASASLTAALTKARTQLVSALTTLDPAASVSFTGLEVTGDGIIVRGHVGASGRLGAVVSSGPADATSMTAGPSWIPGGRIDSFVWSWVTTDSPFPWKNKTETSEDAGRFLWTKSAGAIAYGSVCLKIRGTRLLPDGTSAPVDEGEVCSNKASGPPWLRFPSWWMKIHVPFWLPDPPPDFVVNERIAGHLRVVDDDPAPGRITTNALVHFTGPLRNRPLEGVARALETMGRRDAPLLSVLVLPAGTFDGRRSEIEERLGSPGERFGAQLVLTEDDVGTWSKTFAAADGPSTHLVNARGEFVWRRDGEIDPGAVARALDEHAIPAPPPETMPLRLAVRPGMRARDAVFTDERWDHTSLGRLRGRRVVLVFWQSWSAPCLRELGRLQQAQRKPGVPFVLAVSGGEDCEVLAEVRRRHGFSFPLIQDPDQSIAALYGVRCWPTTISINEAGIVDRVQLGLAHVAREPDLGHAGVPARG